MVADQVFLNGKLVPKDDARVNIDTVAFKYGAMVFEGLRGYWNEARQGLFVFRLNDHSRRLRNSIQVMRMETDLGEEDFSKAVQFAGLHERGQRAAPWPTMVLPSTGILRAWRWP